MQRFINQSGREPVTDDTFKKLKKQDDDIRKQIVELTKKRARLTADDD